MRTRSQTLLQRHINRALVAGGIAPAVARAVSVTVAQDCAESDAKPLHASETFEYVTKGLSRPSTTYAIHDSELLGLKEIVLLTTSIVTAQSLAAFAPAGIAGLVLWMYRFQRRRIALDPAEAEILRIIAKTPGDTPETLLPKLTLTRTATELEQRLAVLGSKRRQDGTVTSLVTVDGAHLFVSDV